jgi:hypothetical protein
MDLNQILDMWENHDCKIDNMQLDRASQETPLLHAKYLRMHSQAKMKLAKLEFEQKTLLKNKWLYYNGKMTKEQIEDFGWEYDPFNGLKVLKGEMNYYYDADTDIQKLESKIIYFKEVIEVLKSIIESLKWRHQTVKNIIDIKRFESGG